MKKLICMFLCMLMLCACAAPAEETIAPIETTEQIANTGPLSDGTTLKVLAIGNSFSNDTTQFLYDIAAAEGVTDIVIGRLYANGCSLEKHWKNAQSNAFAYTYYKNDSGKWNSIDAASLLYGLQDEDWDIITMQQASKDSGLVETYNEVIGQLVGYVNENKTNPNAQLVWNMTWAYQQGSTKDTFEPYNYDQMTMYNGILNAVQQGIDTTPYFAAVIPVGTAIQNTRTSFIGDNLTRDTFHLNDLGKVIGGYTWYSVFTGKTLDAINLTNVTADLTLTDQDKAAIMEAINNAIATPYAVTQSTHTEG